MTCNPRLNTLSTFRRQVHYRGGDGSNGEGKSCHGHGSDDILIEVPPGTVVRDLDGRLAGELVEEGETLVVARGGRGGRGNQAFKTARRNAPKLSENGEPGAEHWIQLELRLVADVGFVGRKAHPPPPSSEESSPYTTL
jgi:GTP-binding protein